MAPTPYAYRIRVAFETLQVTSHRSHFGRRCREQCTRDRLIKAIVELRDTIGGIMQTATLDVDPDYDDILDHNFGIAAAVATADWPARGDWDAVPIIYPLNGLRAHEGGVQSFDYVYPAKTTGTFY